MLAADCNSKLKSNRWFAQHQWSFCGGCVHSPCSWMDAHRGCRTPTSGRSCSTGSSSPSQESAQTPLRKTNQTDGLLVAVLELGGVSASHIRSPIIGTRMASHSHKVTFSMHTNIIPYMPKATICVNSMLCGAPTHLYKVPRWWGGGGASLCRCFHVGVAVWFVDSGGFEQ